MSWSPDCLGNQYRDSSKLSARAQIYQFARRPVNWFDWVAENIDIEPGSKVLELGCGHGALWPSLGKRLPQDVSVTLSDVSPGMLEEAEVRLQSIPHDFHFELIDAQEIPAADQTFDVIIANHVFHHVTAINQALSEVRRVLKPGGKLFTTTMGEGNLAELKEWQIEFDHRLVVRGLMTTYFTLETCRDFLKDFFGAVQVKRLQNELVIPEIGPLLEYIFSVLDEKQQQLVKKRLDDFHCFLESKRGCDGCLHLSTSAGMAVAW